MIRSMFTAISALSLHQKYLDVVSNNLANANTTGYKSSRVLFQDQFAQMMSPGSAPSVNQGGTNPTQVGLGVGLGYISPNFSQGTLQNTGRNMDLGIQGDGFFIYGTGAGRRFSREGSMTLDAEGMLVNSASGLRTQGWLVDSNGAIDPKLPVGDIQIATDKTLARATTSVNLGGNLSATTPVAAGVSSQVDVAIGVYDSLGALQTSTLRFTRATNLQWTWGVVNPAIPTATLAGMGGTITFNPSGQLDTTIVGNPTFVGGEVPAGPSNVTLPSSPGASTAALQYLDMTKMTMLTATSSVAASSQNGLPAGSVSDVYISPRDGAISLVYSNGLTEQIGQLALARFVNPTGLMRGENTTFLAGLNSGDPEIGTASTGGRGTVASGYLEASNVDMAQEFTNMILAQRGFQASAKVITTSDEILQELVNLKR